jgi:uncharacterized protein DUF1566
MRKMGRRLVMVVVGAALCWAAQAGAVPGGFPLCQAQLNSCNANLGTCTTNLASCTTNLNTSNASLATCTTNLNACNAALAGARRLPATGQTTSYTAGDDGAIQAGATLSYRDNGDGTITDNNTGLMWEKLSADGSIHDFGIFSGIGALNWADAFAVHIAGLNAGGGFAGYTDWRLPNMKELHSIVNYGTFNPAVSPEFNTGCVPGCTVLTCSCTNAAGAWSSTTTPNGSTGAWLVRFDFGGGYAIDKEYVYSMHVRAVRGGL